MRLIDVNDRAGLAAANRENAERFADRIVKTFEHEKELRRNDD